MFSKSELEIPFNYRTHDFHLFNQDLRIAGMARPNYKDQNTDTVLENLSRIHPHGILIGLYEKQDFSLSARAADLDYIFIPVQDYAITPSKIYDDIYSIVEQATADGRQVIIHCGAGNGRTGTALAALKLRELLETAVKEDPLSLEEVPNPQAATVLLSELLIDYPCSALVKEAIEAIRKNRTTLDKSENGIDSIESPTDVESLLFYESHLRQLIKQALKDSDLDLSSGAGPSFK
jgi:hypothetical protein